MNTVLYQCLIVKIAHVHVFGDSFKTHNCFLLNVA